MNAKADLFVHSAAFSKALKERMPPGGDWLNGDPHLSLSWYELLAETAVSDANRMVLYDCAEPGAPARYLAVMRADNCSGCLTSFGNFYTPLFGLVGPGTASLNRLVELARTWLSLHPAIHQVRLGPMDAGSSDYHLLRDALRRAGWYVGEYFCFGNWYHPLEPGGYATYLAGRPGHLRNTLKRAEKRLNRNEGASLRIFSGDEANFAQALNAFVEVYGRSWKEAEPFPAFIPGLCRLAAENASLRLGVLFVDERPIAVQLWLVVRQTAYIVKLAYDGAFAHLSPGTLLTAAMLRRVIDVDQVAEIDYLIGDDPYKRDWMTRRRERKGIVAFRVGSLKGLLGASRHVLGRVRRDLFPRTIR